MGVWPRFVRQGHELLLSSVQDGLPMGLGGRVLWEGHSRGGGRHGVTPGPHFSLAGVPCWQLWGPPRCLPCS